MSVLWSTAMVDQPQDGFNAQLLEPLEALVWPAPVGLRDAPRRHPLPEERLAEGLDAQSGEALEVAEPGVVPGPG
jgi:hypothetical protein